MIDVCFSLRIKYASSWASQHGLMSDTNVAIPLSPLEWISEMNIGYKKSNNQTQSADIICLLRFVTSFNRILGPYQAVGNCTDMVNVSMPYGLGWFWGRSTNKTISALTLAYYSS